MKQGVSLAWLLPKHDSRLKQLSKALIKQVGRGNLRGKENGRAVKPGQFSWFFLAHKRTTENNVHT